MSNDNIHCKNIFLNGLNSNIRNSICINYDSIQSLCAIGFNDGTIKIFGKYGYEITFKTKENSLIKNIYFLDNLPHLIIVTERSIEKWDYLIGSDIILLNILGFKKEERIIVSSFENGLDYLIVALDNSNIHFLNVYKFDYSNHKLGYPYYFNDKKSIFGQYITTTPNQSSLDDIISSYHTPPLSSYSSTYTEANKNYKIYPTCIKISPVDANLLLVGYSNGLILVWSIQDKMIEKRFFIKQVPMPYCTSVEWNKRGTKIICSHLNGDIYLINYSSFERKLLYTPPKKLQSQDCKFKYSENINQGTKLIYTNSRKMLLVKGFFSPFEGTNKSLYIIKFNKFKEENYSITGISSNIGPFCIVSSSRYFNSYSSGQSSIKSILGVNLNEQLIEFKYILSTTSTISSSPYLYPSYLKEFNNKSMNNFPKLNQMKQFKCSNSLIIESINSSLYQLSNDISNITGGTYLINKCFSGIQSNSNSNSSEILITSHIDNTLYFWDSSDSKNIIYLGLLDLSEVTNEIITFNFSNSTLIISVKDKDNSSSSSSLLIYTVTNNQPRAILKRSFKLEGGSNNSDDKWYCKVINERPTLETTAFKLLGEITTLEDESITTIASVNENQFILGSNTGKLYNIKVIEDHNTNESISSIQIILNGVTVEQRSKSSISNITVIESIAFIGYSNGEISILNIDKMNYKQLLSTEQLKLINNQDSTIQSINKCIIDSNNSNLKGSDKFNIIVSSNKEISIYSITLIQEFNQVSFQLIKSINGSFIHSGSLSTLCINNKDQRVMVALDNSNTNKLLLNIYSIVDLELLESVSLDPIIKLSSSIFTLLSVSSLNSNSFIYQFNNNSNNSNNSSSKLNSSSHVPSSTLYSICIDKNQFKKYYKLFNYDITLADRVIPNNSTSTISNLFGFNFQHSYNNLNKVLSKSITKIQHTNNNHHHQTLTTLMYQHSSISITIADAMLSQTAHKFMNKTH